MSQSDEEKFMDLEAEEVSVPSEVSTEEEPSGEELAATAERDEALWTDAHTSDEESFDPNAPEDLQTESAKLEQADDSSLGEEGSDNDEEYEASNESDDSIVVADSEPVEQCAKHEHCLELAGEIDAHIQRFCSTKSDWKERRSAVAEVLCDHYEVNV